MRNIRIVCDLVPHAVGAALYSHARSATVTLRRHTTATKRGVPFDSRL